MSKNFNVAPYFDDYNEAKQFIKILFRPEFAVQARELTQSQTMLQKQIERVGGYLFEEGSEVVNAQTTFDLEYSYVKIDGELNGAAVSRIRQLMASGNIEVIEGNLVASLVNILDEDGADPITLYVKYRNSDNTKKAFSNAATLALRYTPTGSNTSQQVATAITKATDATGFGSSAHINAGTRFVGGYFLTVDAQTIILEKYNNQPTAEIGLRVVEEIVTPENDTSLLDNAQGSPNYAAPGAHRYKITLKLDVKGDSPDDFIRILTLKDGVIQEDRRQAALKRNGIDKELAKRMYDQSGNFIVEPFKVEVREHLKDGNNRGYFTPEQGGDESKLVLDIDSGRAYISGYEVATVGSEYVELDKARDASTYNNAVIGAKYGCYILAKNLSATGAFPEIDLVLPKIILKNGLVDVAEARVRNFELFQVGGAVANTPINLSHPDTTWKIYLFGLTFTGTDKDLGNVDSFEFDAYPLSGDAIVDDKSLFDSSAGQSVTAEVLPVNVVQTLRDVTYSVRRVIPSSVNSSLTATFSCGAGEVFDTVSSANYTIYNQTQNTFFEATGDIITLQNNFKDAVLDFTGFSGVSNGDTIKLYATIVKTSADGERRSKTVAAYTTSAAGTATDISLGQCDIISFSVIGNDSVDYTDAYTLDNGQRDGYYGIGSLKRNRTVAAATVTVTGTYYQHSNGDYFTAESYPDYEAIPSYVSSFGDVFVLRDSIDFRPTLGASEQIGDLFVPNAVLRGDITYYLGRIDKVLVDETGKFFVKKGAPALQPVSPPTPDIGMTIYEVAIPPYTFDPSDVRLEYIENKRFTMRDIGKLETRIENLEYYTTLNQLEQSTAQKDFSDNISDRFKNGFLVDSFSGHGIGDSANPDYECSIDQNEGECRPPVNAEGCELSIASQNGVTVSVGNLMTLPYNELAFAVQNLASRTENVNPYAVFSWNGSLHISPSSDTWIDVSKKPTIVVNREETFSNVTNIRKPKNVWQSIWAYWQNVWFGQQQAIFGVAREKSTSATSSSSTKSPDGTITTVSTSTLTTTKKRPFRTKIVQRTVRQTVSDRIVDLSIVPFIREKTIEWEVSRMRPNTKLYPFFDGVALTVGSGQEIQLPDNSTEIITDSSGFAKGTFTIPNTDERRFRTGKRVFRLIDSAENDEGQATTYADAVYSASGVLETRQATITSTRETVTTKNKLRVVWVDPLAQSFIVEQRGGVFITSIDLFFKTKDPSIPVTIQLRDMVNGYPSQNIIPLGEVTLESDDVNVSEDGSVATRFTFDSPVYLQDGSEYCFVVMANSQRYNMFVSQMGEIDILTNQPIAKQPFAGVLFKSQNASTWTADQLQDLKFTINRASFNTNVYSVVEFVNQDILPEVLEENPLQYDTGLSKWKFRQNTHGLTENSHIVIANSTFADGEWTVDSVIDNDVCVITRLSGNPAAPSETDKWIGGAGITSAKNLAMDAIHATFQVMDSIGKDEETGEPLTSIEWSIRTIESKSVDGDSRQEPYQMDSDFIPFEINDTFLFDEPKMIASRLNEQLFLTDPLKGDRSLRIRAILKSKQENLSPVIDMERIGVVAIGNRTSYPEDYLAQELLPAITDEEKCASMRYITKKISLNNPAEEIRVVLDANRPASADIKVFIKYLGTNSEELFDNQPWKELKDLNNNRLNVYPIPNNNSDEFSEYTFALEFDATNSEAIQEPYSLFAIKVIGLSRDSSSPPRIRDFRAIAIT